jgi:hypothetical protein
MLILLPWYYWSILRDGVEDFLTWVTHLEQLGDKARTIHDGNTTGGKPMKKSHPLAVYERHAREVQGEALASSQGPLTGQVELIHRLADQLAFQEQGQCIRARVGNRNPNHPLDTFSPPFLMHVKRQLALGASTITHTIENKGDG